MTSMLPTLPARPVRPVRPTGSPPPLPPSRPMELEPERFERLDLLRGVAMLWMAAFHFCFDLNHFGFIRQNFYVDPVWTVQRTCILSLFLFCAGLSLAVAMQRGPLWPPRFGARFWRRWAQLAGCALLVSVGSWFMFPRTFISFGVLHGIAVMLIVCRLTAGARAWLWPLGLLALALPMLVQHPVFDTRWLNWVGLVTRKPFAEDYVPVLPWLGVMWWGLAAGQWMLARRIDWLAADVARPLRPLAKLGTWSLAFYMIHQPVLIGALSLWRASTG